VVALQEAPAIVRQALAIRIDPPAHVLFDAFSLGVGGKILDRDD
jgi:hypothetical protein